jgi:hypothetical protein
MIRGLWGRTGGQGEIRRGEDLEIIPKLVTSQPYCLTTDLAVKRRAL